MDTQIDIPHAEIAAFCRKHGIRRMELFGSVLRDDFRPDSDVDVMVECEPGRTPGLDFSTMDQELARIPGRNDLLTRRSVETSPDYIVRNEALARVETVYAAD